MSLNLRGVYFGGINTHKINFSKKKEVKILKKGDIIKENFPLRRSYAG